MTRALLLVLSACAAGRAPELHPGAERAAPPPLSTVVLADWTYIGAGSMGRFVDYVEHPSHDGVVVAGADVGGVYLTIDDGASWTNICHDLPTTGVWAVDLVVQDDGTNETTRVILGTDSGIFFSDLVDSTAGLDSGDFSTWTEVGGIERGEERPDEDAMRALVAYQGNRKTLPIGAVQVDPNDPKLVWAGITATGQMNLAQDPKDPYSLQHFDKWKLYRSTDGGLNFEPALRFSAPIETFVVPGYDSDGSVFDILVDPTDSGRVWVSSDRGLYRADNADTSTDADADGWPDIVWTEIGATTRRTSDNLGQSWREEAAGCEDWASGTTASAWCLPVVDSATVELVLDPATGWPGLGFETHPNLRSLSTSEVAGLQRHYVTLWDRGHADDQHADCSTATDGDDFVDSALAHTRGGVYVSDDGGETWRWLLTDTGAPGTDPGATPLVTTLTYRCDETASERNSDNQVSYFPEVEAVPTSADGDRLMLGVLGFGSGLWTYQSGASPAWVYRTDNDDSDFKERFEGEQPLNISGGNRIEVSRLSVDWDESTDGWPEIWSGSRGILRGAWDNAETRYEFEHAGSDYQGEIDDMPAWSGTGLDDAVVWDVLEHDGHVWVAMSDGGLMRAEWVGSTLVYVPYASQTFTPNWSSSTGKLRKDECHAVVLDAESDTIYTTNAVTATPYLYSVLAGDGTDWSIIGGYGYTSDSAEAETIDEAHFNGLYTGSPLLKLEFNDLLPLPASAGFDIELIAATTDGLWTYDAGRDAGAQWERLCASATRGWNVSEVNLDLDLVPGYAFSTLDQRPLGGLLAIDLAAETCTPLRTASYVEAATGARTGHDPVHYPASVALAEDGAGGVRLVVGVSLESYVGLLSGDLDCAAGCTVGSWTWSWSGADLYTSEPDRDPTMKRFDVTAIAVDPRDKRILLASLGVVPGYDYWNPQYVLVSEDGGQTVEAADFESDDHGLPNRNMHQLEFSDDGATVYGATRSSLFTMPVGW